jgi:DNA recombination protein RmuC
MSKKLRDVEALPGEQAANLLGDEREEREDRGEPEA